MVYVRYSIYDKVLCSEWYTKKYNTYKISFNSCNAFALAAEYSIPSYKYTSDTASDLVVGKVESLSYLFATFMDNFTLPIYAYGPTYSHTIPLTLYNTDGLGTSTEQLADECYHFVVRLKPQVVHVIKLNKMICVNHKIKPIRFP